ncbi:Protein of unknown function [Bacillus wiedmannii]|uniref:Uncharacterized protein n=2 Tax=Bacillus cereus group TaxID=86661 RepID=A0A1C4EFB0_9BACI|nr:Protein of unknown function [Bacillus wiedmannii]
MPDGSVARTGTN